jgi:hypothetical protein
VTKILSNEAPNVVTEIKFRSLIEEGYHAEVYSHAAAFRKSAVWYGEWTIRVVNEDRTFERMLVVGRTAKGDDGEIRIREFKTANGLISFLVGLGYTNANIPLGEGGRSLHVLPK